jgi:high-affinity Fe2+/Pb2+ permease
VTWWAWCLIAIIVAGFIAAAWLKRAGEKEWARYRRQRQIEELDRQIQEAFAALVVMGELPGYVFLLDDGQLHCNRCGWTCDNPLADGGL